MPMTTVVSDNVRAVGYDYATQTLRVQFWSGGVYEYYGVPPHLYEAFLLPHPWRRIGWLIRAHRYSRVAA